MHEKLKHYALVICLFVFLLVVIGNGLHLTPAASFGALSGTQLVVFAFNRWCDIHSGEGRRVQDSPLPRSSRCAANYETSAPSLVFTCSWLLFVEPASFIPAEEPLAFVFGRWQRIPKRCSWDS